MRAVRLRNAALAPENAHAQTALEIPAADEPLREIVLLPAGTIETRQYDTREPWHNPDLAALVAATVEFGQDLPVDCKFTVDRPCNPAPPHIAAPAPERPRRYPADVTGASAGRTAEPLPQLLSSGVGEPHRSVR